ncbi:IS4 family transposase [Roseiarcus fermentans]|uniref:IS4 family transposase n=1 Tax=Roseiarcus fermentans TaxID=1473586 RepID=A0A366EBC1_9HYPH|nr:ISAs1 family transposase [Roseiarcus fermentans]RBO99683.1 IS4 family transposase [Roseiarcus fermentans]
MDTPRYEPAPPSGLRLLLDCFSGVEDRRGPERVAHRLDEVLLVCVCATIAECDSFDAISDWGQAHLGFLQRFLPFDWGVPSGRWLNILMNRIDPDLFAACFMDWVRACWPEPPDAIAIDGKTVRRSHDRAKGRAALHLVSAFATGSRLVLGQEAVDSKTNETTAIPVLLEKLAAGRSLQGAVVTIDAIACNPQIAKSIRAVGADYLLAVKGNQPTLEADIEAAFEAADKNQIEVDVDLDKGHGRIETRTVSVLRQVDWLDGDRRFPGELRFADAHAIVRVEARTELTDRTRFDVRYYLTSSARSATALGRTIRSHWGIENTLHWTLDVTFQEDMARVRKGHGAQNMALVRKFAFNRLRATPYLSDPPNLPVKPCRRPTKPPRPKSLKLRRKIASWDVERLAEILIGKNG